MKALSDTFSPIMGRPIDALNEMLVSVGGYGALFCCVQGLVNPGDEVSACPTVSFPGPKI